jgi:hypothetical protein
LKAAAVAVILLFLVVQAAAAFNLVAAEQSKPKIHAWLVRVEGKETSCFFVNETAMPTLDFHWECIEGVGYNASDGSHPQASIQWIDDVGGTFEPSPASPEVHWSSPQGIICFRINVTVSAPGYESDTQTFLMQDIDIADPSGGYVHPTPQNCPMSASVTTTTTSVTTAPIPFLDFPAILIAILLGFFIVARRRSGR